ncbi:hypothetical protein CRU96_05740 [Malaciobacter halophilus]|nr:hypothetical protein [Malaciobacter halophilus]RYA23909.1 hypothetical protein CRU96_05740 [Malaciobacter halophilus]
MAKKYISQSELAQFCGCTQPYIAKLKKQKLFDEILEGGKFPRSRATEIAKIIEDNRDLTREPQRNANAAKKNSSEISPGKKNDIPQSFGMFDVSYLGAEAQVELTALLEDASNKNAVHKIQIKDAFIESKRKELEFKKELGVLIELEQAEAVMELVASNMKTKMYNVSHLFKSKYHKTTKEQVEFLHMLIDEAFGEFNKYGLDDVKGEEE